MSNTVSKQKTISDSQLTVGALVLVRGNTEYSRLLRKIEGEELEKDKMRKAQAGMIPVEKPYTTVQLTNARVIPLNPAAGFTPEEIFVSERFYRRQTDPVDAPWHFTVNNKSPFPNQFYMARQGKTTEGDLIVPENELANGLDVILVLRIFQSGSFSRKGVGLHSIILQEPIRYYAGDNTRALAEAGIILHGSPSYTPAPQAAQAAPAAQSGFAPVQGQAAPATQVAPAAPANAFATSQQNAPAPAAAPAQAPIPAPTAPWTCPGCGTLVGADSKFCNNCGTAKPAEQAAPAPAGGNPYAAAAQNIVNQAPQAGGIRYDAGDNGRNY